MVLCFIALPVFAILGIFSVRYRKLALESLDCIFRTATLRKCRSGLDERIKAEVTGKALKLSSNLASFIYRFYKPLSWLILMLLVWSAYASGIGIYNYAKYGNCNGPSETGFCMLDPTGSNSKISETDIDVPSAIAYPEIENDDPIIGSKDAELTIIEFGCYACQYTKKAEPIMKEVIDYYKGRVNLQFKNFYIPHHNLSYTSALAADCALEQGRYNEYHENLFLEQEKMKDIESLVEAAGSVGMDISKFSECLDTEKYKNEVRRIL